MSGWSLPEVLRELHKSVEDRLAACRRSLGHPGTKGDASEEVWRSLLATYLPKRYQVEKAFVVDSDGQFSQQIDLVIFDRQYSPFIFTIEGEIVVPAESIYGVFEAKQVINSDNVRYAGEKVASVRRLHRTSLPIPHAGGTYAPRPLPQITGGLLCLDSAWNPPLGDVLLGSLEAGGPEQRLDLGCVAAHGCFRFDADKGFTITPHTKAATAFLFELITRLQARATVPMIDVAAYAKWL